MNIWKEIKQFFDNLFSIDIYEEEQLELQTPPKPKKKPYPENYKKYPDNIYEPEKVTVLGKEYIKYVAKFNNLYELYEYLKSNPEVNKKIFKKLSSVTGDYDFAGESYEQAVDDLISDIDPGYEEFLELQHELSNVKHGTTHKYRTIPSLSGGHLNVPAYLAGAPMCYETEERISRPKFVRMYINLCYYCGTTKEQVLNRAIIITNIIKALEKSGYSVDLNTFELSTYEDEIEYIVVKVKNHGESLNMESLYKTLCKVEFLRRILFRILETLDVKNDWYDGYGRPASENFTKAFLNFTNNDIFFDQPREMGINGNDLATDFERAVNHLNMNDKIDVAKAKVEFAEDVKVRRRIKGK